MKNEEKLKSMLDLIEIDEDIEILQANDDNNDDSDCKTKVCEPKI
jgi:hypothetical protein